MKRTIYVSVLVLILLSVGSCGNVSDRSDNNTSAAETAEQITTTVQESERGTETMIEEAMNDSSIDGAELPEEAKEVLLAYVNCDSDEALAECIFPTYASEEVKNGKPIVGKHYFGFGPPCKCEDVTILECSKMPKDQAERLAAFLSAGFSMQGFTADFTSEEGYDIVVSAVSSVEFDDGLTDKVSFKITNRLGVLKIKDDRWIVAPYYDDEINTMEPIS